MSRELNISKQIKTIDNLKDESNDSLLLKNSNTAKKGTIGSLLSSNPNLIQGFEDSGETHFMDTKQYSDYTQTDRGVSAFPFHSDYEKSRAINQTGGEQVRRTLGKLLPKTALEFVGQVGNVLDFEDYANSDNEVGNWLNDWAQEKKAELDEYSPTYRVNPNEALDIGDSAWWLQSGSSLVESAAAFVGLGYLSGAAALKLLNSGGKALEFLNIISKGASATNNAKKGTQVGATLANTLMLNQAEGVGIATNAYNNIYNKAIEELKLQHPNKSDEEIDGMAKQEAADGAASVINVNRLTMLVNLTSAFAFVKSPALTRELRKLPSVPNSLKHALIEGVQEAGEETINMLAENQAYEDSYTFDKALNDVLSAEGAESALLGFVGGAGQTALTNAGRTIKINKDENGKRYSINDHQRAQYAEQQASKSKIESLAKSEKLQDVTDAYLKANETYTLYNDINKAIEDKDTNKAKELTDRLVSAQAYDAFANGTTEQYINVFKGIAELTPEQAELKGLDKKTYKEQSTKAIKKIEALEKEYNKASTYINFNEVYDNRSKNISLKDSKVTLETSLNEERNTLLEDLSDLGIKDEAITFSETGGITFNNYNKYGEKKKAAINNLVSLKEYKDTKDTIVSLSKSINRLNESYSNLTSFETQEKIKKDLQEQRKVLKDVESKRKVAEKKTKVENKTNKEVKNYEKTATPVDTEIETTEATNTETVTKEEERTPDNTPISTVGTISPTVGFTFQFTDEMKGTLEKGSNAVMNSDLGVQAKISKFQDLIQRLTPTKDSPDVADAISQYQNAITYLESQVQETSTETPTSDTPQVQKVKDALLEATEDLAPLSAEENEELSEDEQKLIKQKRLIAVALAAMEEAGMDTTDFSMVANFTQDTIGKSKFVRIFETFKALYNINKPASPSNLTYGDIFFDENTKRKIINNKASIDQAKAFAELYAISDLDFNKEQNKVLKEVIEEQNYKVFKKDKVTSEDVKIIEGFNKLAHLDKKYKTNVSVELTGMFNVLDFVTSKEDLDNELNENTSHIALDYDKFNVGSEIILIPLNEVRYANGDIAYADGRVERDGVIISNDKVDYAPIGIVYNGELLQGHYLHTTEWINENNIADFTDVKRQKANMRKIREAVLNSENGITTTIRDRSNGHFMRNIYGITDTVAKNLPNVEIAIGKDGALFTGDTDTVITDNKSIIDGLIYAVMPVNKSKKYGIPIKRTELKDKPEYIKSIIEAVKLYLNNNPNDVRARTLKDEAFIDITSITGLKIYLEKFLFLNPVLDTTSFMFDNFKEYVENNVREDASIVRIITDPNNAKIANIEFGRGANVGDTIRFINRDIINKLKGEERTKTIEALLKKFENVLKNNTRINIVKNNFNKSFQLPIITDLEVTTKEQPYNDFVKEHTNTDLYSYTLDTGKEVYTVQPNFEYDTTFAFRPVVKDTKEAIENINDIEVESAEETGFNPFEDIDNLDITNYAPITLPSNQVEYNLKSVNILNSDKAKQVFEKGNKNNWDLNKILTELSIPKEQKKLILDLGKTNREEIITDLLANYSYTIEINTAKATQNDISDLPLDEDMGKDNIVNTQYYSNLTVPGGTNYTENEITTPLITPSIKGHAQFATDKGIGWFRSDEQTVDGTFSKETKLDDLNIENLPNDFTLGETRFYLENGEWMMQSDDSPVRMREVGLGEAEVLIAYKSKLSGLNGIDNNLTGENYRVQNNTFGIPTKTRRVLEVQSDLFQKGRDKKDLIGGRKNTYWKFDDYLFEQNGQFVATLFDNEMGATRDEVEFASKKEVEDFIKKENSKTNNNPDNQFLQLLNKDNNWVTFFIKSIIQDSAKKGYEKVLFPSGNTASKVEGHTTLEEFKKQKEDRIKELENQKKDGTKTVEKYLLDDNNEPYSSVNVKIDEEINQLKAELARIETEGFGALKPIYNFYENTVTNILKKNYAVNPITDEYGNTWNEVDLTTVETSIDLAPKTLSIEQQNQYEDSILNSLFITGIGINLQEVIINNVTANVLKKLYDKNNVYDPLTAIDEFFNKVTNVYIPAYQNAINKADTEERKDIATKGLETAENVLKEANKITNLILNNLQQYHGLIKDGKVLKEIRQALEDDEIGFDDFTELINEEGELMEYNAWESDGAFKQDFKKKLSQETKNYFSYIEDVQGFKVLNNKRIAIPKKVWGIELTIPFDQVFNELSAILAYSNYQEDNTNATLPTIESMKETIEQWIPTKPYLHNVLEKLENAPEELQNTFINVMSKSYTHHLYIFKNKKGNLIISNSDSNNIVKVIQNQWLGNIVESDLIESKEGEYIVNEKKVNEITRESKELQDLLQTSNVDNTVVIQEAKALLDKMGFNFPLPLVNTLIKDGVFYNKKRFSLLRLFSESDGAFKVYIDRLNAIRNKPIEEHPIFNDATALNSFTREIGKLHPVYFTNSFKDVRGRTYYGYSNNKFITDRVKALKTNSKDVLTKLAVQPFSSPSYWVKQFINNPKFKNAFGYFTFDGKRNEGGKGKKLEHMSPAEIEEVKIGLFYDQNKYGNDYIVNLLYPTTSDKSVSYGIRTFGFDWNNSFRSDKSMSPKRLEWLYDMLVSPEINRILSVQDNIGKWDIKGYEQGGTMFHFIPSLNSIKELWIQDGNVRKLNTAILTDESLRDLVKNELTVFINKLIDKKVQTWTDFGFVKEEEEGSWDATGREFTIIKKSLKYRPKNDIRSEAGNYVINYLVANVNIFQTFTTDPAFYWKSSHWQNVINREQQKDNTLDINTREEALSYYTQEDWIQEHEDLFENMGKRLAGDAAPGKDLPNSPNETFTYGFIADDVKPAYLAEYYKGLLGNDASGYFRVNGTDAQEFTTLQEHLLILHKEGNISKKRMNDLLFKDKHEMELNEEELKDILQPVKPVYVNNIWNNGIEHRLYVKSSSFPLFKQLTKNLELDKLRQNMENNSIDRVAFESAVKVGGSIKPTQIFKDGKILSNAKIITLQGVPREGFKIQQEVPYDENKNYINDGTQQRKLLTASVREMKSFLLSPTSNNLITGREVQQHLDNAYNELFKIKYDALIKELGYNSKEGTLNMRALQDVLVEEALSRSYPLYDLEALVVENNKFIVPLWATGISGKIEAMLNSIVDNRIRKIKPKGKSYVLGTSAGFKLLEGELGKDAISNTRGIIFDKSWKDRGDNELRPMRIEDASGRVKGQEGFDSTTASLKPAEVILPFRFTDDKGNALNIKDFMVNGLIDVTKLPSNLLEIFGFRIPTQGLSSMAYIKVVGFLPKRSGDLLIAPADWTVQMGSDFDVDKLFTNSYNTSYKDGVLSRYNGNNRSLQLENEILDLHFSILGSKDEKVQAMILKPLDLGKLPQVIDEVYPLIPQGDKGIGISEEYQSYKYRNARAAKSGVGVFSTDSTFLASVQDKGIKLTYPTKTGIFNYNFNLGGFKNNGVSDVTTNSGSGRLKSDVNSAIQSLAVDNENEQGMHKLNINNHTFDAIRTLVASGFEEDIIFYFMNQPIIRKYVELKTKADDTATPYTVEQLELDIKQLFPVSDINMPLGEFMTTYGNPSKEVLLDMIKKGSIANPDVQQAMYKHFKDFTKYGKKIQQVQSAINSDSAGLGKDLFYSTAKEEQLMSLPNNNYISNASSLIGEYITLMDGKGDITDSVHPLVKEWYEARPTKARKQEILKELENEGYIATTNTSINGDIKDTIPLIKPTTINGFASVYALLFNNNLWSKNDLFPYTNIKVQNVIERIKADTDQKGESVRDNAEVNKAIFSTIKSFIATKFANNYTNGNVEEERYRLLMDTTDNTSIASITKALVDSKELNNAFVNRLEFDINKSQLPSNVRYNASNTENINERSIYAAVAQMLTDDTVLGTFNEVEYSPKKVMQDLITHQMLTGGVQQSQQFLKYVPISYLKTLGYYDSLKNLNFNDENEFNTKAFEVQHIQHNPKTVEVDIKSIIGTYKFYNEGTAVMRNMDVSNDKGIFLPDLFSIINPKAVSGYTLYYKDSANGIWRQIDTLGHKQIKEYDASKLVGKSLIPLNKVKEDVEITLPLIEKEVEQLMTIHTDESNDSEVIYDPTDTDVASYYNLRSNETSLNKFSFILNRISDAGNNKYNSFLASQLHNNLDKLKEYRFILDNSLQAKGEYSLLNKTITINLKNIRNNEDFENIILEEIIHAYTKEALINNTGGEVARLKGLRLKAVEAVRSKLGEGADIKIATTIRKVKEGIPLNNVEETLIYPILNDVEFVGRLFKSKELQELLNEIPSDVEGKSVLERMWDLVVDLLNSIGIDIKKGSALEYATIDIISLINQKPPSDSIKGEMQKLNSRIRTPEFVYERFNLLEDDGSLKELSTEKVDEVVKWVNENVSNLIATNVVGMLHIRNKSLEQLSLFTSPAVEYFKGFWTREQISKQTNKVFLFGDNTQDRVITKHVPYKTQAVIRGLPNAIGIDTKKTRNTDPSAFFTDKDFPQFKQQVDEAIKQALESGKIIVIPADGIGTGKAMLQQKAPKLFNYLTNALKSISEDLAPATEQGKSVPYLKAINNRIERLELNIEKAEKREDYKKVEELKDVLEDLKARRDGTGNRELEPSVMQITLLTDIARKGEQDMQEIAEMLKRKVTLEDTLYIRKVIHFWKTAKQAMFTADDLQSKVLTDKFSEITNIAERHEDTLTVFENKYMEGLIKKYGNDLSVEDIFNHFSDINGLQRDFLNISRIGNPVLDSIFLTVKDANVDALDETKNILQGLNELENKIRPILKSLGYTELYDVFRQRTENGKLTGHIVNRFSSKFLKEKSSIKNSLKSNRDFNTYHQLLEWARKNTKEIELKYLFPINELNAEETKTANEYKAKLKQELGDKQYADFMVNQAKLIEQYENFKQGRLETIAEKYNIDIENIGSSEDAMREFNNWRLVNSPYVYTEHMQTLEYGKVIDYKNFNSPNFIYQIPKDNTDYDSNFKTIEANEDLLEFYEYYKKVDKELKTYMPSATRTDLAFNGIPYIEKVLFEEYKDKGMKIGLTPIMDGLKKSNRDRVEGTVNNKYIDPVTEIEEKRLGLDLTANNSEEYFAYINTKTIEYQLANNKEPSRELLSQWGEEITDKLAQQKSYDLPRVLKVYALTVLAYKHKARIEDNIKLAQNILGKQREFERNSKGQLITDSQNRLEPKSSATSFINTKKQFDYFVQAFYGKTKENEGVTDKKVYTKEEKERVKQYNEILEEIKTQYNEGKIDESTYENYEKVLNTQIDNVGGVAVWSKRGDNVLKYVQLKSMGWNIMSAIANIGFGYISNRMEGAGGKLYTSKQLTKAYSLVSHSVLKNWTFNSKETDTSKKIRSLMDNWNILQTATKELFKNPLNIEIGKSGKWLTPYNLTERTEYLNQAPIMIAMMMNKELDTIKGKVSMWEAFDINGEWKSEYGEKPVEAIKWLRHKIDQTNYMNHGDYGSPLRIKNEFKGRALSQFRTWMFEGIATRFENEKEDTLLGTRKGRYISLVSYFKAVGASKGTINVVKGILNNISFGTLFGGLTFDEDVNGTSLKEVDAQNMRKVMSEVVMLIGIYTSYLMLKAVGSNLDDEDDKYSKYALNVLVNQGVRLKTDILFYTNPSEFKNLLRDLIPAASLIKDGIDFIDASQKFIVGDDEITTGVYSGNSRLLREVAQGLPLGTQVYKNINYSVQTFDK
jgi:hypothetical protein